MLLASVPPLVKMISFAFDAEHSRQVPPGLSDDPFRPLSDSMEGGGIAVVFLKEGGHGLDDLGVGLGGRAVV